MANEKAKLNEDWLAVWIGLAIFALSLGVLWGVDLLGWGVKTSVWLQPHNVLAPVSKAYAVLPGILAGGDLRLPVGGDLARRGGACG